MEIRCDRLQTGGFFACHCLIEESAILAGIVAIDYSRVQPGMQISLLDPDSGESYPVRVPNLIQPAYDVEIERISHVLP